MNPSTIRLRILVNGRTRVERSVPQGQLQATVDLIRLKLLELTTREHFAVVADTGNISSILWRT